MDDDAERDDRCDPFAHSGIPYILWSNGAANHTILHGTVEEKENRESGAQRRACRRRPTRWSLAHRLYKETGTKRTVAEVYVLPRHPTASGRGVNALFVFGH
ncbi:hypothetical protein MRX96_027687 [Rhipicephalus microplus]